MRRHSLGVIPDWTPAATVFAALFVAYVILKGGSLSQFDLQSLTSSALPLAIVALGQFFVVLTNGIDLSLGPVMSVAGTTAAVLVDKNAALGLLAACGLGLLAGAFNALLVTIFRLEPIIATLASMSIWQGAALIILPSSGGHIPSGWERFSTESIGGVLPVPLVLLVAFVLLSSHITRTRFGTYLRAVGGDASAAKSSGVPVAAVTAAAYLLAGLLASLAGIYETLTTATGSPTMGDDYILTSIAAVVIGGVMLVGGRGSAVAVALGALTLTIIGSLLYFANLSTFFQSLLNGVVLIAAVSAFVLFSRFRALRAG